MKGTRLINQVVGGSYEQDERIAGCAVSQNLYAESVDTASNGFYYTTALRSVPGERVALDNFMDGDANSQNCRGVFVASDESIFAAFGDCVYRISRALDSLHAERIFTFPASRVGRVRFCETGGINSHVCWVDGSVNIWAYPLAPEKATSQGFTVPLKFFAPLRQYKTADQVINDTEEHVAPTHICAINGSLCINDPLTDTWYFTDPFILGGVSYTREIYDLDADGNVQYVDGSNYEVKTREVELTQTDPGNATSYLWLDRYSKPQFTTASFSADTLTAIVSSGEYMFAFGGGSIQVYSQALSTDAQGFSSVVFSSTGRNVDGVGCKAVNTIVAMKGSAIFLATSSNGERSVMTTNGGEPVRISTNAIDRMISGKEVSDAFAFCYTENGHAFYCLTVPAVDRTFVYDFSTSQWHNRSTYRPTSTTGAWWPEYAVGAYGRIYIAGRETGKVVELDRTKFDDYKGDPIIKRRTAPILTNDYSPFMVNELLLLWNTGTTTDETNESGARNPVVMLEVSRDGGNTFEDEQWAYGGEVGQYAQRTIFYGLGVGNLFVFRFTISDRVNVVITGAKVSYTPLSHF